MKATATEKALLHGEGPYNLGAVEALSTRQGEPPWLLRLRREALEAFLDTPLPDPTDEVWRRTDIRQVPFHSFDPLPGERAAVRARRHLPPALAPYLSARFRRAGLLVQVDGSVVYASLSPALARQGALLMPLAMAGVEHPDLVRAHLGRAIPLGENRFTAMNTAFWQGGYLLYLPPGVEAPLPFHIVVFASRPGLALFPRGLIALERGARAVVVEEHLGGEGCLEVPVVEATVGPGASLHHYQVQDLGRSAFIVGFQRNSLGADARAVTLQASLGAGLSKTHLETLLEGPGGHSEMLGLTFASGSQHFDHYTLQDHRAPATTSNLLYKGVLRDRARTVYYGSIRIRQGALKSDAYQQDRNLLLEGSPRAESVPVLEIEADDVRCSHGATAGPVDREQLFYLMSRGLPRLEAQRLLVEGFLEEVLGRVAVPWLQERLRREVHRRTGQAPTQEG